jgi:hypothetical protein
MKTHLLIAALLTTLAHAKPFPPAPGLNELVAAAAKDRRTKAPHFAESPIPATSPDATNRLTEYPVQPQTKRAPSRTIASIKPMTVDPFRLKLEFIWQKPHGQWMNQLLKDIEAARKAGDTETFNALTARYSAWADKYLRRDDPPKIDGIR